MNCIYSSHFKYEKVGVVYLLQPQVRNLDGAPHRTRKTVLYGWVWLDATEKGLGASCRAPLGVKFS